MTHALDPIQLGSIEIFCRAATATSFTDAARHLGLTPAAVSRSIARLEQRLGVRLFERSTRQLRLTDAGVAYFEECSEALLRLRNAEQSLQSQRGEVQGLLRVSLPTTYAHHRVLPHLAGFLKRFPALRVELNISNRNIDFIEEGFDLAVRLGEPQDSRVVARKLEDCPLVLVASPRYVKNAGRLRSLQDLEKHRCIPFVLPRTGRVLPWLLRGESGIQEFVAPASVLVSDDVLGCVNLALNDAGVTQTYLFIAQPMLDQGQLVRVLPELEGASRPFFALMPSNRFALPKLRHFVDFLAQRSRPT
jgi:DNA-binding transcriptional LysR family regulator